MTTPTTAVTPETLAPIVWERQRVITTELLAKLYGATPKQINDNYQNNAERFGAGSISSGLRAKICASSRTTPK
ncbi:ORF6N domain-containing protein [Cupriavidus basilensis]